MKKKAIFFFFLGCCVSITHSQTGNCANSDFEYGSFSGWQGGISKVPTISWTAGIISNGTNATVSDAGARHTIMTSAAGFDPVAINPVTGQPDIPVLAPGGGTYSVRLGNSNIGETEKLLKSFLVSNDNTGFTYQYAVVLEDPKGGHAVNEKPKFFIRLLDASGNVVPGPCGSYSVFAGSDPTFISDTIRGIEYKKWTTVGIDLSPYIGQTITIEFTTSDCSKPPSGGHFGYAYVDAKCGPLEIEVTYCPEDPDITLTAPEGYATYSWVDNLGKPIGNTQKIVVQNPKLGDQFTVSMNSVTGCQTTVLTTLKFNPHDDVPDYKMDQNIITPNGDNINDRFFSDRFKYTKDFMLQIFNRFGQLIYETNDVQTGWDGKLKDGGIAEGVYYWVTSYISRCSENYTPVINTGFLHVIR